MNLLYWVIAVNLLTVLSIGLLAVRPARFLIPWLALATVVVGTALAFSSSATLYSERSIGVGIGWMITSLYGFLGLGIFAAYVRLRPLAYVPLGAIVAGVIYVASFYVYILPPFNVEFPGMMPIVAPGLALVAYGAYLWYRNGLAESLEHRSRILRLAVAVGIVSGLGVIGFLQFEGPRPGRYFAQAPNLPMLAEESELVVEGVVMSEESLRYRSWKSGKTLRYKLYEVRVSDELRGNGQGTVRFAVQHFVPLELNVGRSYLIFSSGMSSQDELSGYWRLREPAQVLTSSDGKLYPYPGLPRVADVNREVVEEMLEAKPFARQLGCEPSCYFISGLCR